VLGKRKQHHAKAVVIVVPIRVVVTIRRTTVIGIVVPRTAAQQPTMPAPLVILAQKQNLIKVFWALSMYCLVLNEQSSFE
jgi:hypothetical protein